MAFATLLGMARGLIKIVVPAIGLTVGIIVAGAYYDALAHRVFSSHSNAAYVISFVIIVLIFLVFAIILAYFLQKTLSKIFLGLVDRLLGGILCFLIASLVIGAILAVLLKYSLAVSTIEDSAVASFLVDKFPLALSIMPGDFDTVKSFFSH